MVTFLLSRGARPDLKDSFKRSAIDEARRRNYTRILALLENVKDYKTSDNWGH